MTEQDRLTSLVEEFAGLPSETSWVEFKENNYDPQRIGVLISAISNAARLDDKPCGFVV
jgi:ATP-dependent DNA helicase RecG